MQFKSLLFLIIVVCVGWSLVVSCAVFIEGVGDVEVRSELPADNSSSSLPPVSLPKGFSALAGVIHALNYFLPIGVACLALLVYVQRTNPGGIGTLMLMAGILAVAALATWKAGLHLQHDGLPGLLARQLWWY